MKIEYMSIDLETFSSIDISRCGVYKYAESPDAELLLFACSVNGGLVTVYDVADGGEIPEEILAALSDESVTKWAYNAAFERVFLSVWLAEEELQPLVDAWRASNPNIVQFWWDVDRAVKDAIKMRAATETYGVRFIYQSGMLFIALPSGRRLSYVKPRIGENRFGGESVTYEGVGTNKNWERIESYGPKFVENIVQAVSRDILMYAMRTFSHCSICGHVHDELIIECSKDVNLDAICRQMGRTPEWIPGLLLRADGFEAPFYKKD